MSNQSPSSNSRKRPISPEDGRSPSSKSGGGGGGDRGGSSRRSRREEQDEELPWWELDRDKDTGSSSSHNNNNGRSRRDERRDSPSSSRGHDNNRRNDSRYDDRSSNSYNSNNNNSSNRNFDRNNNNQSRSHNNSSYNNGNGGGNSSRYNDNRSRNDYNNNNNNNNNNRSSNSNYNSNSNRDSQDIQLNYSDKPSVSSNASSSHLPPASLSKPIDKAPSSPPPPLEPSPEPIDPEIIIAERRRKRAEIAAKYANVDSTTVSEVGTPMSVREDTPVVATTSGRDDGMVKREGTESPPPQQESTLPFSLFKESTPSLPSTSTSNSSKAVSGVDGEEEMSAADYNPDMDRIEDDRRQAEHQNQTLNGTTGSRKNSLISPPKAVVAPVVKDVEMAVSVQEEEEDEDDMFSIALKPLKEDFGFGAEGDNLIPIISRETTSTLTDNFDDPEGYYILLLGELLDSDRYHVQATLGKGMFSAVVRAKDLKGDAGDENGVGKGRGKGEEVAIKVIRSQESMYKAGQKETQILKKLQEADPLDKKHLIRLLRTFEHRGHLCLVFESLSMNLREVVKRYGKDVGINLSAVRAYASQMFLGLSLLKKCDVMHSDIKPDNILVNESKSLLKICDLGSASDLSENDITPYLVSRFYRAPEIRLPYDCALDTWSIGCTLYELYTGKILFPGRTNNHMLYLMMELKGKLNHKLIKKSKFGDQHFDESVNFILVEKSDATRTISIPSKPTNDLKSRLMQPSMIKKLKEDEIKMLSSFIDLLDKMLNLESGKRPTPKDMLNHPFIRG